MQLNQEGKPFCYYHPQAFEELRTLLQHFDQLWEYRNDTEQWLQKLPLTSTKALSALGFREIIERLRHQCRNKQQFDRQLISWFDALKTLQFIHQLRDTAYPNLPLEQAIQQAAFKPSYLV